MGTEDFAARKTVRVTTRGRTTGLPRTVSLWFVAEGPRAILVQHATRARANWYRNLAVHPAVTVDFGSGPIAAAAAPITDPARVRDVLARVRRKYWTAWLVQWLGRGATPVAAHITW